MKIGGRGQGGWGGGGQGGCEQRIEVFVKFKEKKFGGGVGCGEGGSGWGDRVDVNEELKFWEIKKNIFFFGGGGPGGVGQDGCERRIGVFVKIQKKEMGGGGGGGGGGAGSGSVGGGGGGVGWL